MHPGDPGPNTMEWQATRGYAQPSQQGSTVHLLDKGKAHNHWLNKSSMERQT